MRIKKKNAKRTTFTTRRIVSGVSLAMLTATAHTAVEFHPRATLSATWIDNINLVDRSDPARESEYVLQANPGFSLVQEAQRIRSSLDYSMQNLFFLENSDRDATYHEVEAALGLILLPDYFYFDMAGGYSRQIIDPRVPTSSQNFFGVENQTDAITASAQPSFRHEFDLALVDVRYSRGIVEYDEELTSVTAAGIAIPIRDAETETRSALLESADDDARVSWGARYEYQQSKYDLARAFKYEEAHGELGVLLGNSFRIIGRAGAETDPVLHPYEGGFDNETWEGGFRYRPGDRTQVEAFVGERFFGKSYRGSLRHDARRARWNLTYSEGPMTQAQELAVRPVTRDPTQQSWVGSEGNLAAELTPQLYVRKVGEARFHITGRRTDIDCFGIDYRREFIATSTAPGGTDHTRGAGITFTRRFAAQTSAEVTGRIDKSGQRDGTRFQETIYQLELRRELGEHVSTSLAGTRMRRSGNADFVTNWVTLSLIGRF